MGRVVDDELVPVGGAYGLLVELDRSVMTDEGGAYGFDQVPAGSYALTFTMEGYEPAASSVTVRPGEATRADVLLVRNALPVPHHAVIDTYDGYFTCGFAWWIATLTCDYSIDPATFQTKAPGRRDIAYGRHVNALQTELVWEQSSSAFGVRLMRYECVQYTSTPRFCLEDNWSDSYSRGHCAGFGPAPLVRRCFFAQNDTNPFWSQGRVLEMNIRPAGNESLDAGADPNQHSLFYAFQRFTFYVTAFYEGASIPENYAARPDD